MCMHVQYAYSRPAELVSTYYITMVSGYHDVIIILEKGYGYVYLPCYALFDRILLGEWRQKTPCSLSLIKPCQWCLVVVYWISSRGGTQRLSLIYSNRSVVARMEKCTRWVRVKSVCLFALCMLPWTHKQLWLHMNSCDSTMHLLELLLWRGRGRRSGEHAFMYTRAVELLYYWHPWHHMKCPD